MTRSGGGGGCLIALATLLVGFGVLAGVVKSNSDRIAQQTSPQIDASKQYITGELLSEQSNMTSLHTLGWRIGNYQAIIRTPDGIRRIIFATPDYVSGFNNYPGRMVTGDKIDRINREINPGDYVEVLVVPVDENTNYDYFGLDTRKIR